jgi:hypothetical protein
LEIAMTRTRWTGLAGLLFGITFFLTVVFAGSTPESDDADSVQKYADYWKDTDHSSKAVIAAILLSYAFLVLVAFAAGLRDRLRAVDAGPLPSFVLAAGTVSAALLLAGGQIGLSIGVTLDQSKGYDVDGKTALLFDSVAYQVMAPGLMAGAVMAVLVGLVTLRTRILPAWTAWLGFLLGLTALGTYFSAWAGFFGLPLWSAVMGIVLLLQNDTAPAVSETPAMPVTA